MQSAQNIKDTEYMSIKPSPQNEKNQIETAITKSWAKIAPFWPLKNLIAVNPLSGFEDLPFEEALKQGQAYFQQNDLPEDMQAINRESIKWLQAYFDNGQSTIAMPGRRHGFLKAVKMLMAYDISLKTRNKKTELWFKNLPEAPQSIIGECLLHLGIAKEDYKTFLTLMLTTLPGWAAHIQYRTAWADTEDENHPHKVNKIEYLAFRMILTALLWPKAKTLLDWHKDALHKASVSGSLSRIENAEKDYRAALLDKLIMLNEKSIPKTADAQLVFCIDVRSEPFRKSLEAQGNYETLGFAGFFGVPVSVENEITGENYHSCPVLLKPAHHVKETSSCSHKTCSAGHERQQGIKRLYQSLKYNFTTPFALVETLGPMSGLWMGLRSLLPGFAQKIKQTGTNIINPSFELKSMIESIPFDNQVAFASGALRMMGLTSNFAPLVVFCGHGSTTQNNAYATALNCGACGGRHGAPNARILAGILNNPEIREALAENQIDIPASTHFLAAEHNTTTDQVEIYKHGLPETHDEALKTLKADLEKACVQNTLWRCAELGEKPTNTSKHAAGRSQDWAQVRPEWGLARNAAFIIGPRSLTQNINLEGRSFLHSYDWTQDPDGSSLTTILTAPMVVAQWINSQYLFSTLDNVAYGGGSKITKNITGKIGIMQGNASDLMHGLPLQSVYKSDKEAYHEPMRLMSVVCAPRDFVENIIQQQDILKRLFGNGWVTLVCFDPELNERFMLKRDLTWARAQ